MAFLAEPGGIAGVASGLALAILGGVVLAVRPRSRASLYFSATALLWGAAVAATGLSLLTDDLRAASLITHAYVLLHIPLYVPLLYFVTVFPWPTTALARSGALRVAIALPAFLLMLLFVARPTLFVARVYANTQGLPSLDPGPLYGPVVTANAHLAFAIAAVIVFGKLTKARGNAERNQLALVAGGLLAYVSYRGANLLRLATGPAFAPLDIAFFASALIAAFFGLAVAFRRRALPWRPLLLACGTIPLATGSAELLLAVEPGYRTFGLWRIAAAALFAYALARYRLFDLDLKIQWAVSRSVIGAVVVAVFFAASEAAAVFVETRTGSAAIGIAAATLLVFLVTPLQRLGERVAGAALPRVTRTTEYEVYRKLQIYSAAFEEAVHGGVSTKERAMLERLRRELHIEPTDAERLERDVAGLLAAPAQPTRTNG